MKTMVTFTMCDLRIFDIIASSTSPNNAKFVKNNINESMRHDYRREECSRSLPQRRDRSLAPVLASNRSTTILLCLQTNPRLQSKVSSSLLLNNVRHERSSLRQTDAFVQTCRLSSHCYKSKLFEIILSFFDFVLGVYLIAQQDSFLIS